MEPLFWPRQGAQPIRNLRRKLPQGQIFWQEVGRGQTLIFLHGTWSDSGQWQPLLKKLGPSYHCLAPDLIGFGESARLKPADYAITLQVEALGELLTALRVGPVYLVAESLGAWVAARFALQYPDRVRGLVLMSPEGVALAGPDRWRTYRRALNPLVGLWLRLSWPLAKATGRERQWLRTRHLRRQLLKHQAACKLLFKRKKSAIAAEQLQPEDRIQSPILLIQGESASPDTQALNQSYGPLTADQPQQETVPGCDDLAETQTEAVAASITGFIGQWASQRAASSGQ
ncbi:MAG: alpha/beta hydrolase [Cyanobacteria bacterium J06648_16]